MKESDEEQIMTKQTLHMTSLTPEQRRIVVEQPPWNGNRTSIVGEGTLPIKY